MTLFIEMKFVGERPISAKGVLTLLGVSKPVELKISQFYCAPHPMNKKEMCGAEATVSIKRSEYGMNRYLPGIGDEVKLAVQIEAFRDYQLEAGRLSRMELGLVRDLLAGKASMADAERYGLSKREIREFKDRFGC